LEVQAPSNDAVAADAVAHGDTKVLAAFLAPRMEVKFYVMMRMIIIITIVVVVVVVVVVVILMMVIIITIMIIIIITI